MVGNDDWQEQRLSNLGLHRTFGPTISRVDAGSYKGWVESEFLGRRVSRQVLKPYQTLLLGTRNALSQNQQLLKRTKCEKLFYAQETASKINGLQVPSQTMNCYEFQPFEELLDGEHVVYPWEKTFEEARDDPVLILHSSGTTGKRSCAFANAGELTISRGSQTGDHDPRNVFGDRP